MRLSICAAIALTSAGLVAATGARAAGTYDGSWVFDIPASAVTGGETAPTCPALRMTTQIRDSQISSSLQRGYSGGVQEGSGSSARPLTGSVTQNGALTAQWENYRATGQLAGEAGRITVQSQCGPRTGTATRVAK